MDSKKQNRTLRVAFPVDKKVTSYEPTSISLDYEYIFLENVFSPLVEIMADGSIAPGVAEKLEWVNDELKLSIRKNLKTSSGSPITAEDVVFSLKRLIVLSANTHGNFRDIVCPGVNLKSIEETCPGIRKSGNDVFLNAKGRKSFLLPMLGAIDFAIIPQKSVDPKTLKITDYAETTGVYSVQSDDGQGNVHLRMNPNHYFASEKIADEIILVPTDPKTKGASLTAFRDNRVDHLTTIDATKSDEMIAFAQSNSENESHITTKIRSLVVFFTERGQKELTPGERRYIGEKLQAVFSKIYAGVPGYEQRSEFFPSSGEGGLTSTQLEKINRIRKTDLNAPEKTFKLGLLKRLPLEEWSVPISKELPTAEIYLENNAPDLKKDLKPEDYPHAVVVSTDTGFMEDISLISYTLNAGLLGFSKTDREKWLADYMATDNKEIRINKLKELHFKSLAEPYVVPLMASPYTAIVRKPWKMELSEFYANNQLWRIKLH